MIDIEEFSKYLEYYQKTAKSYLDNYVPPTDLASNYFVEYFTEVGKLISDGFDVIPETQKARVLDIYKDLNLVLFNKKNELNVISEHFETVFTDLSEIINELSQIASFYKLIQFTSLPTQELRLQAILKQKKVSEKEDERRLKAIEDKLLLQQREIVESIQRSNTSQMENVLSSFLERTKSDFTELTKKCAEDASSIENLRKLMEVEIEDIKTRYNKDISNFEFIKQEEIFTKTADGNKKSIKNWMIGLGILFILLIVYSYLIINSCWINRCNLIDLKYPQDFIQSLFYTDLAKNIIIRFFMLSVLILLIRYCIKNINALLHNHTTNMHKANSLAAAMRIINTITEQSTRDVVLQAAAKEIFTQQKTGYLSKEDNKIDINLLEKLSSLFRS